MRDERLEDKLDMIQKEIHEIRSALLGYRESGGIIVEVKDVKRQVSMLKKLVYTVNGLLAAAITFISTGKFL